MLIVLMARVPIPGKTKTRLQSHLSAEECAQLHEAFIQDMITMIRNSNLAAALAYTPESEGNKISKLVGEEFEIFPQLGDHLGEKMKKCLAWGFGRGHCKVGIIGTDMPDLQPSILIQAEELLENHDVVIGPAEDGGYYFIGMKKTVPEIFDRLAWGGGTVRQDTIDILQRLGLTWALLPFQRDVDVWQDVINLKKSLEHEKLDSITSFPENTYRTLQSLQIEKRGLNPEKQE